MTLSKRDGYQLIIKGQARSGEAHIVATGFQHGPLRQLQVSVTDHTNSTTNVSLSSDSKAQSIVLRSQSSVKTVELVLSGLSSQEVGHVSFREGSSAPELFTISIPTLIKKKSIADAVQGGHGQQFLKYVGKQGLDTASDEYGTLLNDNPDFKSFLDHTEPNEANVSLMAWYCWVIFLTPGLSIAGLFIKTCRG